MIRCKSLSVFEPVFGSVQAALVILLIYVIKEEIRSKKRMGAVKRWKEAIHIWAVGRMR
jgi:uncharacterized membrane protein